MKAEDLDYNLPEELIATRPAPSRDASRLLLLDRKNNRFQEKPFSSVVDYLHEGDCVVFNNTKVIKARLIGKRENGRPAEILLVESLINSDPPLLKWKAMVKNSRKLKKGCRIHFQDIGARIMDYTDETFRIVEFDRPLSHENIDRIGIMPIPPYIARQRELSGNAIHVREDNEWYQSIFANKPGSVAAPTASLHFTSAIVEQMKSKGVNIQYVTLHVGPGTFRPIEGRIDQYQIHREWIEVSSDTVDQVKKTKENGGRVMAVGTTSTRALETAASDGTLKPYQGYTQLYITPGYSFKVVDQLLTNFHMPRSSLLLLVYAFAGTELVKNAYRFAIENRFRFYSYGDAMLII